VDSLLLSCAQISASLYLLGLIELGSGISSGLRAPLTVVVHVLSAEVASIVRGLVSRDHGAKALRCRLYGSVDEGKLCDVVLVDHAQDGLVLPHVVLRLLDILLVRRLELPEAIIADQMRRLLLRLAIDGAEGCGEST